MELEADLPDDGTLQRCLWRSLPPKARSSWITVCKPFFINYVMVSTDRDSHQAHLDTALLGLLSLPGRSLRRASARSLHVATEKLKQQLSDFSGGHVYSQGKKREDRRSGLQRRIDMAETLVWEGHAGKAAEVLTRKDAGPVEGGMMEALRALHPAGPALLPDLPVNAPELQLVDAKVLVQIIRSMSKGSAPGRSGWTPDLLYALITNHECLEGIARVVADIINGRFQGEARRALLGSLLTAIPKPNGKFRPIAMGETFYKLACLYALRLVRKETADALGPNQYAMRPGGSEVAVQTITNTLLLRPEWGVLSVDMRNAFNSRDRGQILGAVYTNDKLQLLWRLVDWAYGRPSKLWVFEEGRITNSMESTQGVKQGDPLASFLFALSMSRLYSEAERASGATLVAVQDDVFLLGEVDKVVAGFKALKWGLRGTGLSIEPTKSTALAKDSVRQQLEAEGLDVSNVFIPGLGVCISRDREVISKWLLKRMLASHTQLFDVLGGGKISAQAAFHILRRSTIPSMNYWSRAVSPQAFAATADRFDAMVKDTARLIFKLGPIGESVTNQMILPIRLGGLGLTSLAVVSPIAWLCSLGQASASFFSVLPVDTDWLFNGGLNEEVEKALKVAGGLNVEFKDKFPVSVDGFWARCHGKPNFRKLQGQLIQQVWDKRYHALLRSYKPKSGDYARLTGVRNRYAGSWLSCVPNHEWLRMDNMHWQAAGRLRLGLPPADDLSWCGCGANLKVDTSHFLSCKYLSRQWTFRHNRLTRLLMDFAEMSGVLATLEPGVGDRKDRADVLFSFASCLTLVDLTVVDGQCQSHRGKAVKALAVAARAEQEKMDHYEDMAREEGRKFYPLVLETTGGIGPRGKAFCASLVTRPRLIRPEHPLACCLSLSLHGFSGLSFSFVMQTFR